MYLRQNPIWFSIEQKFDLKNSVNAISVVTLGELWSIGLRNQWGERRMKDLDLIAAKFVVIDINIETIIKLYAQIDVFSQGKLKDRPLSISARNMGKNDLWIAASTSALKLELLTSDLDFNHLNDEFLTLQTISL